MKNYTNAEPVFSDTISIYESTDAADAENVLDVPLKQLQDNALWLKENAGLKGFVTVPTVSGSTT
ncbi:MAG: hypothetical protein J5943_03310 [Oribacterium sp.]|nr:hypothetical protein [Oribacterium sp.]